jgi:hypothetical protein
MVDDAYKCKWLAGHMKHDSIDISIVYILRHQMYITYNAKIYLLVGLRL